MEKTRRSTATRTFTAAITAVAVIFCQLFYNEVQAEKAAVKTEQQETAGDQVIVSLQSGNLPSSSAVVIPQAMFFLFEICFEQEESAPVRSHILLPPNRIYQTLIESVISPNAP